MATSLSALSRRALLRGGRPAAAPRIRVGAGCLARRGIVCEACRDVCEAGAIRFRPAIGRAPVPAIDLDRCTGCGECAALCPAAAIELATPEADHAG